MNEILTMHFGPEDVAGFDFADSLSTGAFEEAVSDIERRITMRFPQIRRVFIEAQSRRGRGMSARSAARAAAG